MRYMLPRPQTQQQYFKDLKRGKPIKKDVHLKEAINSREYKKWLDNYYQNLHKWYEGLTK